MLRQGLYVAENDESIWNAYTIEMRVKETDKSYIFELVKLESRYAASHIETFFSKDKRVVLRKNKGEVPVFLYYWSHKKKQKNERNLLKSSEIFYFEESMQVN